MDVYHKLIQPFKSLSKDLYRAYYTSKIENSNESDSLIIYSLIIGISQFLLFICGSNIQQLSISSSLSILLPLQITHIKDLIFQTENENNLFKIFSFVETNCMKVCSFLIVASILHFIFVRRISFLSRVIIILLYYFKTIYQYSELRTLPFSNFCCCIFCFSIGCLMIISKRFRFLFSSIFYGVFSSLNLLILFRLNTLEEPTNKEETIYNPLFVIAMTIVSVIIQHTLFFISKKPVFLFQNNSIKWR